jgi:hypothetical protein
MALTNRLIEADYGAGVEFEPCYSGDITRTLSPLFLLTEKNPSFSFFFEF